MAQIPHSFQCPITTEVMRDPVQACDGHSYERVAIEEWIRIRHPPTSPMTNRPLQTTELVPNVALRNSIEEFLAANESVRERIEMLESLQRQVNIGTFDPGSAIYRFICPINHSVMRDPVTAADGVTYDKEFIELWIAGHSDNLISPSTRKPMGTALTPNVELRRDIEKFLSELPRAGAPPPDDPVNSVRDLSRAFDILDGLNEVLAEVLENWGAPRIVVVGNQSAGKSTVLERLCMMPLFPRDRGLCTSVPIRIDIRRSPVQRPTTLETWNTETNKRVGRVRVIPHNHGDVDIRTAMAEVMARQGGEVNDTHELRVRITSPTLPPMSLVDLPGTIGYPPELKQRTHGLVMKHLATNRDRSTYLVVVRADQNGPRDSGPIEHIMSLGASNRAIGVLTHCDKLDSDRDHELLAGWLRNDPRAKDSVPLEPHGWVATMNKELRRVSPDENDHDRLLRQAQRERRWFEEEGLGAEVAAGRATTSALINKIGIMYSDYLFQTFLPSTIGRLGQESLRCASRCVDIGMPPSPGNLRRGPELERLGQAARARATELITACFDEATREYHSTSMAALQTALNNAIPADVNVSVRDVGAALDAIRARVIAACREAETVVDQSWINKCAAALADNALPFRLQRFPVLREWLAAFCASEAPHLRAGTLDAVSSYLDRMLTVESVHITMVHDFAATPATATVRLARERLIGVVLHHFVVGYTVPSEGQISTGISGVIDNVFADQAQEIEAGFAEREQLIARQRRVDVTARQLLQLIDPESPIDSDRPLAETVRAVIPNLPDAAFSVELRRCVVVGFERAPQAPLPDAEPFSVFAGQQHVFGIASCRSDGTPLSSGGLPFVAVLRRAHDGGATIPVTIDDSGDGAYSGTYTVPLQEVQAAIAAMAPAGGGPLSLWADYECDVTLYSLPLPGSPFRVRVKSVNPNDYALANVEPTVGVGLDITFNVVRRQQQRRRAIGDAPEGVWFTAYLCSAAANHRGAAARRIAAMQATVNADGSYTVRCTAPQVRAATEYNVVVRLGDEMVHGSPATITVVPGRLFAHVSDFDENGVLHHIKTSAAPGGRQPWRNGLGGMMVTGSGGYDLSAIINGGLGNMYSVHQNGAYVAWISIDLGERRRLRPTHYSLRLMGTNSWRIEGSEDGATWTQLRVHRDDNTFGTYCAYNHTIQSWGPTQTATWPIAAVRGSFRHFRIFAPNTQGNSVHCQGIELYGFLEARAE